MCFENLVLERLETLTAQLQSEGYNVDIHEQYTTKYQDKSGQSKVVDFALLEGDETRIAFEVNCYKAGGSKPSEIKRSYDRVSTRMREDGVEFVWITDGQAWAKSLTNVLREGYKDIVDVYNIQMVETYLTDDVQAFLANGPAIAESEINVEPQQPLDMY